MAIRLLEVEWARCFSCERMRLVPVVKRCSVLCIPSICMHLAVVFKERGRSHRETIATTMESSLDEAPKRMRWPAPARQLGAVTRGGTRALTVSGCLLRMVADAPAHGYKVHTQMVRNVRNGSGISHASWSIDPQCLFIRHARCTLGLLFFFRLSVDAHDLDNGRSSSGVPFPSEPLR